MWSLTLTDIIQFIIMTVGMMLVLMPMSIVKAGGWDAFTSLLPAGYYQLSSIGLDTILVFFLIYFFGILIGGTSGSGCYRPQRQCGALRWAGGGRLLRAVRRDRCADRHGRQDRAAVAQQHRRRLCRHCAGGVAGWRQRAGGRRGVGGADVHRQRLPAGLFHHRAGGRIAGYPAQTFRRVGGRARHHAFMGAVMLGLAFVVRDVLAALTLAYNLLVGGMLIPLVGAIFWPRATSAGAIASMLTGSLCVVGLMARHGIDANSPIYGGLLGGGVAFVLGSLLSRPAAQLQPQTER